MALLLLLLMLLWLAGALGSWPVLRPAPLAVRFGAPAVVGEVLYVTSYSAFADRGPWQALSVTLLLAALIGVSSELLLRNSASEDGPPCRTAGFGIPEMLCSLAVLAVYTWRTGALGGYDELNHFFFASQMARGKFPPGVFAFVDDPAKYHFGWDILLAAGRAISGQSLPQVSDTLTLSSLAGAILLLAGLLRILLPSAGFRCLGILGFFLGGGLFEVISTATDQSRTGGLGLYRMYQQHSWSFAVSMFLLILNVFACQGQLTVRRTLLMLLWFFPLFFNASLYAVTLIPFVALLLAIILVGLLYSAKGARRRLSILACIFVYGVLLLASWFLQYGMLYYQPGLYDSPTTKLAPAVLGWKSFLIYEGAYLLMAPIGLLGFCLGIAIFASERGRFLELPLSKQLVVAGAVFFFPLPLVLIVENSAYWDNFCKFNYFGLLASWILVPMWVAEHWHEWRLVRWKSASTCLVAACVFAGTALLLSNLVRQNKSGSPRGASLGHLALWEERVRKKAQLISYFQTRVPLRAQVVILNKDLKEMYPLSPLTNKPEVDLYLHIRRYFNDFRILAQACGVSVVNFYDYNFMYNRARENALRDALNRVYAGDNRALKELACSYVLVMNDKTPTFLSQWQQDRMIEEECHDEVEGWTLYRIQTVHHEQLPTH